MPSTLLLHESGNPVRYTELRSSNDEEAHREAMALLMRTGRFAAFELWYADLRIEVYKPLKDTRRRFPEGGRPRPAHPSCGCIRALRG
jgi:hypothetical protein